MADYHFLSTWLIKADRGRVFDALLEGERWPEWWPGCEYTREIEPGGADGVGRKGLYRWRSQLGYRVEFVIEATAIEPPRLLEGVAEGELIGVGRWRLFSEGEITCVVYQWEVDVGKRWMRFFGPLLAPLLRRNHDLLMAEGAQGLADHLGGRLVAVNARR